MKRLKLAAFQAKSMPQDPAVVDQLLGQVLGNCHDKKQQKKLNDGGGVAITIAKY